MKDQQDCVLNDLGELGSTESFLKNQYSTGIFSCVLLLLAWRSSTFRQTDDDKTQNDPEDDLLFSRIQSLHHCLEVGFHDEEDESIVQFISPIGIVLVDELAECRLRGFALTFDRLAKSPAFNLNAYSSNCNSEVSCSLSSWSLLFKFVTNSSCENFRCYSQSVQ